MWGATSEVGGFDKAIIFQSTLPVWGATMAAKEKNVVAIISIHAPRVGSDIEKLLEQVRQLDFNPRSPCGERLAATQRLRA